MNDDIPDFLRLAPEERKKAWEANPPKPTVHHDPWKEREQQTRQKHLDHKRMQRCISKQKREIRDATQMAKLEDRAHVAQGHQWDARTANWIDPIQAALENKMPVATATKKEGLDFGFRAKTNYARMMAHLVKNLDKMVTVEALAKEAYATDRDLKKHCKRVLRMAHIVQEEVIKAKHMACEIKKERKENGNVSIGLFAK